MKTPPTPDLLLINLPETQSQTASPPLGLWSIRENLPTKNTVILDRQLPAGRSPAPGGTGGSGFPGNFPLVGISARFSSQHDEMLNAVKDLSEGSPGSASFPGSTSFPGLASFPGPGSARRIHVGGPHAALCGEIQWNSPPPSICPDGNGENYIRNLFGFPSMPFPELSLPTFSMRELRPYWKLNRPHDKTRTRRWLPIELSRGCFHKCHYCSINRYYGTLKRRPIPKIEDYFIYLKENGIQEVLIEDDFFDTLDSWTWEVIDSLNRHDLWWSTPNGLPARSLLEVGPRRWKELKRRCWRVSLPFETGDPLTAERMNLKHKYLYWEEAQELVLRLRESGIQCAGFFIIGYPEEDSSSIRCTLSYANSLPLTDRYIYLATPYPGTFLYEQARRNGWLEWEGPELYRRLSYRRACLDLPGILSSRQAQRWRDLDGAFARRRRKLN